MSTLKIATIGLFLLIPFSCFAQSNNNYDNNIKRIDEYINGPIKTYSCEGGIVFPVKYKSSKINSDTYIISLTNNLVGSKINNNDLISQIKKAGKKKAVITRQSINGLVHTKEVLLKGSYLRVNIILGFIDDVLVRRKVRLTTTTHGQCGSHGDLLDFKLIKDFFIKKVDLLFNIEYDEMTSDTIYFDNLESLAKQHTDYRFNLPASHNDDWLRELFIKQYQSDSIAAYSYSQPPNTFVKLIKEGKIEILTTLLFSPNYVFAIHAMESLIYLDSQGEFEITPVLRDRINKIKNQSYIILQIASPDLFYKREGYKALKMNDELIIKKYKASM